MERILIIGVSGLLGSNLAKIASSRFDTFGIYHSNMINLKGCHCIKINLLEKTKVEKVVAEIAPKIIFHCAALTDVEECEKNPELASQINVAITELLVKIAKERDIKFVYISTDAVFDGKKGFYSEDDIPSPLNIYADTKLKGEELVKQELEDFLIVRTNFYGWNFQEKMSLAEWMFSNLLKGNKLTLFSDIFFTPILVNDLCEILLQIVQQDLRGIFHIAGSERISKYEFGKRLASVFNLRADYIVPISVDSFPFKAERPKNMSLSTKKASDVLPCKLPNVNEGLRLFKKLLFDGYVNELKGENFLNKLGRKEK